MFWEQRIQYAALSDIGFRRKNNQDSCAVQMCESVEDWQRRGHLFLVADGMGGHAVGELASKIATDTLPHTFFKMRGAKTPTALKKSIEEANEAIHERANHNTEFDQMGTTCSALVLSPRGALIGHVGDSRVYRIRQGQIEQLTFDHSLQWELIRQGQLSIEEAENFQAKNVITRSLGPDETVNVDVEGPYPIHPQDRYVLCSDGLTNHVNDTEIGMIASALPPADACRLLVNMANLRGGSDNITVVICQVGDSPTGELPPELPEEKIEDPALEGESLQGWLRFGMMCFLGIALLVGVVLILMGRRVEGAVLCGFTCTIGFSLISRWQRKKAEVKVEEDVEGRIGDPYRKAPARLTQEFLDQIVAITEELERNGHAEAWPIHWGKFETARDAAVEAKTSKQSAKAFRFYAQALGVLMEGVGQHRRKLDHDAKWGKKASSPS